MCGLASIFAYSASAPRVDADALGRVRDAMAARGPDGAGLWLSDNGRVGLAHRRLAILDLSEAGAQPMAGADGRLRIVFNGEIYNYRTLRTELERAGVQFRSNSDTEVLLELYRRHGRAMLGRLRGMYALALWDADKNGLLLARDPFGIKPLYLADDGGTLRAASQVKALLAGGGIDTAPDPAGHAGFFLWGHVPEPFTLYRGIRALPAGGWLWCDRDGIRQGLHFDLRAEMTAPPPPAVPLAEALADSVRAHLVADVPVGVFLSGGLDSTALAAQTAALSARPPQTLTLAFAEFAGTANDEAPLAEAAARLYGTDHYTESVTAGQFATARDSIVSHMDQPTLDGVNTWFVARAARARGWKVALSGLGGDELLGGYDSFRQIPRLVRSLRPLRLLPGLGRLARVVSAPWIARVAPAKTAGLLELGTRYGDAYLLRRGLFMPWELPQVMEPDMARSGWRELAPLVALNGMIEGVPTDRLRVSALESGFYMRNQLLRDADWAGMAHSLEIRTPLVDVALFRALLAANGGTTPPSKLDMAATALPPLPPEILNRRKTGFFIPVAQWLGAPSLRAWAKEVYSAFGG